MLRRGSRSCSILLALPLQNLELKIPIRDQARRQKRLAGHGTSSVLADPLENGLLFEGVTTSRHDGLDHDLSSDAAQELLRDVVGIVKGRRGRGNSERRHGRGKLRLLEECGNL